MPDGCLAYIPNFDEDRYGMMRLPGENRIVRTHLIAWELEYGPRKPGLIIRHSCDFKPCFELTHLLSGTIADNMQDRYEREGYITVRRTTQKERLAIYNDPRPQRIIAQEFGIDPSQVSRIKNHWKPGHDAIDREKH